MNILAIVAIGLATKELSTQIAEVNERKAVWLQAREYADHVGKPMLVVGAPKKYFNNHQGGDVTIDLDPNINALCDYEIADVRDLPYSNKQFGSAFCSHVLEHLTADDAVQALREMHRVADKTFVVSPHRISLFAKLHPEHRSWIIATGDGYIIEDRASNKVIELVI